MALLDVLTCEKASAHAETEGDGSSASLNSSGNVHASVRVNHVVSVEGAREEVNEVGLLSLGALVVHEALVASGAGSTSLGVGGRHHREVGVQGHEGDDDKCNEEVHDLEGDVPLDLGFIPLSLRHLAASGRLMILGDFSRHFLSDNFGSLLNGSGGVFTGEGLHVSLGGSSFLNGSLSDLSLVELSLGDGSLLDTLLRAVLGVADLKDLAGGGLKVPVVERAALGIFLLGAYLQLARIVIESHPDLVQVLLYLLLGDTGPQLAERLLTMSKLHDVCELGLEVKLVVVVPGLSLKLAQLIPLLGDRDLLGNYGAGTLGHLSLNSFLKLLILETLLDVSLNVGLDLGDVDLVNHLLSQGVLPSCDGGNLLACLVLVPGCRVNKRRGVKKSKHIIDYK